MKAYSVVIDLLLPDDYDEIDFHNLDVALSDAIFDVNGEVLNISEYIRLEEEE